MTTKRAVKPKKKPATVPEPKWIPAKLEGIWLEEDGPGVTLRFSTGGYQGPYGQYREKHTDVVLRGREPWEKE